MRGSSKQRAWRLSRDALISTCEAQLLTRMFEGKYFLYRFTLVTVRNVRDVTAVKLRRPALSIIYSAQIFGVFGEKFFLADVCLQK